MQQPSPDCHSNKPTEAEYTAVC